MTPHAVVIGDLGPRHFTIFNRVVAVVNSLPDGLTCHEVCEAVAGVIPQVWWVKGRFAGWDHSWLEVKRERVIIDAYPWASHAPFMVVSQTGTPWAVLYRGEVVGHSDAGGPRGRVKSKKTTCRCCKHCVHVKSLSGQPCSGRTCCGGSHSHEWHLPARSP